MVGMIRFLQYGEKEHGDYPKKRRAWLGNSNMDAIADEIKKIRK